MENNNKGKTLDINFNDSSKLIQAIVLKDIIGEPKCKSRKRRKK